ncbi:fasciclin domain-containing protein [Planotetraspora sp. GP83]|uniref:fasciclin domain-containing protein n=1 Tax=Planotetraspora sp. GP83 TaxID=3156264 RepID=UPI003515F3BA
MKTRLLALSALTVALSLTTACGGSGAGDSADNGAGNGAGNGAAAPAANGAASAAATRSTMAAAPFGAACSAVPASGKGSFAGMAADPVATAASNNPVLSTLVTAVKKAGLVDTLNAADGITVFAPTNDAFAKIPKQQLDQVLADQKTLTSILTYHVVKGRKTPADLRNGSFPTLQGGDVTATGSGESFTINNDAKVVCGDVTTRNATVYIIDTVLMPKK